MDVETVIEETARDAAAEADRVIADEAAKAAQEETAKRSAEGTGKEFGDHTDGIPAAGAPGATPVAEPPPIGEDQPSTSDVPPSSSYLKAGDNLFISMPGTASTGVPVEGETLDGDVVAAASNSEPKEEQLPPSHERQLSEAAGTLPCPEGQAGFQGSGC